MRKNVLSVPLRLVIKKISRLSNETRGTTAIEYGLIAGLLALGIVNMLYITRSSLQYPLLSVYSSINTAIQSAV